MITTPTRPVHQLTDVVDGVRAAVAVHADWADTAAPPGDIHRVRNTGDTTPISIHVYGTDIIRVGASARRYYG